MNSLKWAIATSSIALSCIALPAEAASVVRSTKFSDQTNEAAYAIEGLVIDGTSYDVTFNKGTFFELYGNPVRTGTYSGSNAEKFGQGILTALVAKGIDSLVGENLLPNNSGIFQNFYIPKSESGPNPGQHLLLECFTVQSLCPNESPVIGGILDPNNRASDPSNSGSVIFAQFAVSPGAPGGGGPTAVPTPALLPGLLGMGATVLRRKKKQATEAMNA